MKLYDYPGAPNPRRVHIFLAEKGIEVESVTVDITKGEQRSEEFQKKNPLMKIPTLELDDGTYISESVSICRYFEEIQPEPPLFGVGAVGRANVDMWQRYIELGLLGPVGQVWRHVAVPTAALPGRIPEAGEQAREAVNSYMKWLDRQMAGKPFIAGDDYSIADITALCTIDFARALVGIEFDEGLENVWRWHGSVKARPSAKL